MAQKCPVCNAESQRMYGADWCPQCGTIIANALDWQAPKSAEVNFQLLAACKAAKKHLEPDLAEPGRTVFWNLVAAITASSPQG